MKFISSLANLFRPRSDLERCVEVMSAVNNHGYEIACCEYFYWAFEGAVRVRIGEAFYMELHDGKLLEGAKIARCEVRVAFGGRMR